MKSVQSISIYKKKEKKKKKEMESNCRMLVRTENL